MAKRLAKIGIHTVQDILYHVPFRYNDFSLISPISRVRPGETVTVAGTVTSIKSFFTKTGKKIQEARISDETDTLTVIWFNQPFLLRLIKPGMEIRLSGEVSWFGNKVVMSSPVYEITKIEGSHTSMDGSMRSFSASHPESLHTGRIVPVYPETEGVTSKWLRGRIDFLLNTVLAQLVDPLPNNILHEYHLDPLQQALKIIHFPDTLAAANEARRRLAFDELFVLQLRSYTERHTWETTKHAPNCTATTKDIQTCVHHLPFRLTDDQNHAISDIRNDLSKTIPMNRLLEGDVGSGKTVVAAIAMYMVYKNGLQSVLMAPTEILAHQHYETISTLLTPLGITVGIMTGSQKSQSSVDILVGTHALLSDAVKRDQLGLVVIDEQQRFGVGQRAMLLSKKADGNTPHFLTMTATPIPRTVVRVTLGNVDLSVLGEMPLGRRTVKTWVVPPGKRDAAYQWIQKQIDQTHGQAFIICPFIEESETLATVKSVKTEYERLKKIFPMFALELLHGRLKPKEKTSVLDAFRQGRTQILVSTPVVEVGIDVPNAMIMMIEGADRFGLGQLHQLRGRVGRGSLPSYCLIFTDQENDQTITRLKAMETIFSGPLLADMDTKLRGPGELFGVRQHGFLDLRVAHFSDTILIEETKQALTKLSQSDPDLTGFPLLRAMLEKDTIERALRD